MFPLARRRIAALGAAMLLLVTACGSSVTGSAGAAGVAEPEAQPSTRLFGEFATLGGDSIDLGSLEGQDVVLWFWAPW